MPASNPSHSPDCPALHVALFGNPNTGKSTLFSALARVSQRVGNYPGVTVEKKVGVVELAGHQVTMVDLPGTYSLAPRSPDEMVSVDVLLGRCADMMAPDVIVCVVDASHIERNLYLVSQALELCRPIVVVLNKTDIAREHGIQLDVSQLSERLGVAVIETQAHRQIGLESLTQAILAAYHSEPPARLNCFPAEFNAEVSWLEARSALWVGQAPPRYLIERVLLDTAGYLQHSDFVADRPGLATAVSEARERLEQHGCLVPTVETTSRYGWVDQVLDGVLIRSARTQLSWTDKIDQILTHRIAGSVIFIVVMIVVFQSIFSWAGPLQDAIGWFISWVGASVAQTLPAGTLQSLVVDGVIAGVGAVLVFVPQIAILFFFIALLEDCGYMARAAYLTDGFMSRIGLSGKSFIPLLSSFACAVPGIMATRVIEDRRDRLVTMMVAPLMSCSARLPVYTLLIAAFIPDQRWLGGWLGLQGLIMFGLYCLGIVVAIVVTKILKTSLLKGRTPPFVMELPDYRIPSPRLVVIRLSEQSWVFVRNAGTLILAVTVLVWAAGYYPRNPQIQADVRAEFGPRLERIEQQIASRKSLDAVPGGNPTDSQLQQLVNRKNALQQAIANRTAAAQMEQSFLGRAGKWIAPVVKPLGWDWRIGCAVIASFPAREVVIGAMGVIFNLGNGGEEEPALLKQQLHAATWPDSDRPLFTIPVAMSIMVFFALCAQCGATLVTIRRETDSWWWPLFTFVYMTVLAYLGAWLTFYVGNWICLS